MLVLLEYLERRPQAGDTLEGITEWWLLEQQIRRAVAEVRDALRKLVREELLVLSRRPGRQPIYRVNPGARDRIRRLLREASPVRRTRRPESELKHES
jgi:hypothetical protein